MTFGVKMENEWRPVCSSCKIPLVVLEPKGRLFFRHWEIRPFMPIFVTILISTGVACFFFLHLPYIEGRNTKIACSFFMILFTVLFFWSYFSSVCSDPGFLPYNWALTQKYWYTWEEQLTGLAQTQEQYDFVKDHPRPPHVSFSRTYGRFVIRGDHICDWISNWVGKRNHKQFILMLVYGSCLTLTMLIGIGLMNDRSKNIGQFGYMMVVVCLVFEILFSILLILTTLLNIYQLLDNKTSIEVWNNRNNQKLGVIRSMREICGQDPIICFLCPTPAFREDSFYPEDQQSLNRPIL